MCGTLQKLGWQRGVGDVGLMHRVLAWCLGMQESSRSCMLYGNRSTVVGVAMPCESWDEPPGVLLLGWGRVLRRWNNHGQYTCLLHHFSVCRWPGSKNLMQTKAQRTVCAQVCCVCRIGCLTTWRAHCQKSQCVHQGYIEWKNQLWSCQLCTFLF